MGVLDPGGRQEALPGEEASSILRWLHAEIAPPGTEQTPISQEVNYVYQDRESTR